jgi:hypothetical protein
VHHDGDWISRKLASYIPTLFFVLCIEVANKVLKASSKNRRHGGLVYDYDYKTQIQRLLCLEIGMSA